MERKFGFQTTGEKPAEVILGNVPVYLDRVPEALAKYSRDKNFLVMNFTGDLTIVGVYQGMTQNGLHVIYPTTTPAPINENVNRESPRTLTSIWTKQPTFMSPSIVSFCPATKSYLNYMARDFDKVSNLGKILED